jgi:cell division protein FtsN
VTASAAGAASTAATPPTATPPTGTPPTGTASTAAVPGSVPPDAVAPAKRVGASTTMPLESAAPPPTSERSEAHRAAAPVDSVAGQPHPSRGEWAVQLGSFASKANAEKLVRALSAKGHTATISAAGSGASLRYRVRMASLVDREAAERVLQRLKAQGQAATLVPPAP